MLLAKNADEFYLAIIEDKSRGLTDEEIQNVLTGNFNALVDLDDKQIGILKQAVGITNSSSLLQDNLKQRASEIILKSITVSKGYRDFAILTMIGNEIYNIFDTNNKFIDRNKKKIIRYDNLLNYFNKEQATFRLVAKEEEEELKEDMVLFDPKPEDEHFCNEYYHAYIKQEEDDDLTEQFIKEVKGYQHKIGAKKKDN